MRKWLYPFVVIALALTLLPAAPAVEAQRQPTVLAFFYGWYNPDQWNDPNLIDRPAEPYNSADAGVIARQISQAQSAGIDGFVMSWFGPGEPYTSSVFGGLLDQAASQGFKVAVDIDMGQGFLSSVDEARTR